MDLCSSVLGDSEIETVQSFARVEVDRAPGRHHHFAHQLTGLRVVRTQHLHTVHAIERVLVEHFHISHIDAFGLCFGSHLTHQNSEIIERCTEGDIASFERLVVLRVELRGIRDVTRSEQLQNTFTAETFDQSQEVRIGSIGHILPGTDCPTLRSRQLHPAVVVLVLRHICGRLANPVFPVRLHHDDLLDRIRHCIDRIFGKRLPRDQDRRRTSAVALQRIILPEDLNHRLRDGDVTFRDHCFDDLFGHRFRDAFFVGNRAFAMRAQTPVGTDHIGERTSGFDRSQTFVELGFESDHFSTNGIGFDRLVIIADRKEAQNVFTVPRALEPASKHQPLDTSQNGGVGQSFVVDQLSIHLFGDVQSPAQLEAVVVGELLLVAIFGDEVCQSLVHYRAVYRHLIEELLPRRDDFRDQSSAVFLVAGLGFENRRIFHCPTDEVQGVVGS